MHNTTHASTLQQYNAREGIMMQQSWILMCELCEFPAAGRAFRGIKYDQKGKTKGNIKEANSLNFTSVEKSEQSEGPDFLV